MIEQFEKLLKQLLYRTSVLSHAWELFALYDENATRQRKYFERRQFGIVSVGIVATAVVVLQVLLRSYKVLTTGSLTDQIVHNIIVLLPIIVSILIAAASRFTPGSKWVLLRANAEAIKREIYHYRTDFFSSFTDHPLALISSVSSFQ
jgi:protein-S-isoprenylcysteine O-methyltransferase Ste14